uniref:Ubiquitin n=1 Tax=Marseillevirus LCMAC101 TaxID=2506602 RepID=A0A481YRI4_9VIRU|nr:MAG: ubiquitin [Marseillevirus LCMAC101]
MTKITFTPDQLIAFLDQFVCAAVRKQAKNELLAFRTSEKSGNLQKPDSITMDIVRYDECKVSKLKEMTKEKGLKTTGKKAELVERLKDDDRRRDKEAGYIELHCKTLMGRYYDIKIKRSDTVSLLKEKISEKSGIPVRKLKLYGYTTLGQQKQTPLDDDLSVGENDLYPGSSVYIHMRLVG